jgi:2-methylaconitate cis-trans-isomerase PrpF
MIKAWLIQKLLGKTVCIRIWRADSDEVIEAEIHQQDRFSEPIYGGYIEIEGERRWITIN